MRRKLYDVLIVLFVFLLSVSIPFSLFIKDATVVYIIDVSLRAAFLIFAFIYIYFNKMTKPLFNKPGVLCLILLPFLLMCVSNYLVCLIDQSPLKEVSILEIGKGFLLCALVAVAEELVFRVLLYDVLKHHFSTIVAMLLSSLIFGAIHLFNITSIDMIVPCLLQMVYSFGLGMILCLMYEISKNYIVIVLFHFLFNFLNDKLITALFDFQWNLTFYLVSIGVGVFIVVYYLFTMFYINRTNKELLKSNR